MEDTAKSQTWSIIIFGFNEAGSLRGVIDGAKSFLGKHSPGRSELILVDDGSTDGTKRIFQSESTHDPSIKTIVHATNLGIGRALRSGYENATCENIVAIPADGQFDISELEPHALTPENTIVSFFRLENTRYSMFRNSMSYLNKVINRWLNKINLKDVNWVKVYKRKNLEFIEIKLESSLVESELCGKLIWQGTNVIEVPSQYLKRNAGKSKGASPRIVWQAFLETLRLVREIRRFKKKYPK